MARCLHCSGTWVAGDSTNSRDSQLENLLQDLVEVAEKTGLCGFACECANEGLALFEERAGGFPRTGINICINGDATLTVAEAAALAGQVNAITAVVEGGDGVAADVANEILELLEERVIATFIHERDVTQEQLP